MLTIFEAFTRKSLIIHLIMLIADETTSYGREVLAVCLRFLEIDYSNFQLNQQNMKFSWIFFLTEI